MFLMVPWNVIFFIKYMLFVKIIKAFLLELYKANQKSKFNMDIKSY